MFLPHILSVIYLVMYSLKRNSINHRFTTKEYCLVWSKWQKYLIEGLFISRKKDEESSPNFARNVSQLVHFYSLLTLKNLKHYETEDFFMFPGETEANWLLRFAKFGDDPFKSKRLFLKWWQKFRKMEDIESCFLFNKGYCKQGNGVIYYLTHFSPVLHFLKEPVICFVLQNKWLVFLWNATLDWNRLTQFKLMFPTSRSQPTDCFKPNGIVQNDRNIALKRINWKLFFFNASFCHNQ